MHVLQKISEKKELNFIEPLWSGGGFKGGIQVEKQCTSTLENKAPWKGNAKETESVASNIAAYTCRKIFAIYRYLTPKV